MSTYNIHAGHGNAGGRGCGAVGILDESIENRKVKDTLIGYLQAQGHTVYDCTFNGNESAGVILQSIVERCNQNSVGLDISIHLNAGRNDGSGDGSTGGVEVIGYDNNTAGIGGAICAEIASTLGIRNRGFKTDTGLYVLKHTKAQAIIIECCFVDDKDDADRWDAAKCAKAIAVALTGQSVDSAPASNKYSVGQTVSYGTSYPNPTLPCGYQYATGGSGHGTIVAIVSGQAKYQLNNGLYVNDGDINGLYAAPAVNYYPAYTGGSVSIVDALSAVGADSSFANRKAIAQRNGILGYQGPAGQNNQLLALLKAGKLVK